MGALSKMFSFLNRPDDEPVTVQRDDFMQQPLAKEGVWSFEPECDELAGAYGPFGTSPTNPIPVNGILGESVYINRLRSPSGVGFLYHRLGSMSSPVYSHPVDHFELVAVDASMWIDLYFAIYHPRRSLRVPEGLRRLPWRSMSSSLRMMAKVDLAGMTSGPVADFPYGLAAAIEESKQLRFVSLGLGKKFAREIRKLLSQHSREEWTRK